MLERKGKLAPVGGQTQDNLRLTQGSKWQQLVAHLQRLVEPFHRSELAYKERKGELFRPGWLAWAAETPR